MNCVITARSTLLRSGKLRVKAVDLVVNAIGPNYHAERLAEHLVGARL